MTTDNKSTTGAGGAPDCLTVALGNFLSYLHTEENKRNEILNLLRALQGDMRDLHKRLGAVEWTVNATKACVTQEEIDGNVDPHDQAQAGKTNFNDLRAEIKRRYESIVFFVGGEISQSGTQSGNWQKMKKSAGEWSKTLKNTVAAVWEKESAGGVFPADYERRLTEIKALVDDWERDSGCEVKPFWPESGVAMGDAGVKDSDGITHCEVATKVQDAILTGWYGKTWKSYESLAEAEKARYKIDFCLLPALISESSQSRRVIVPAQVVVR